MSCDLCASISVYVLYTCFCVCVYVTCMFLLAYVRCNCKYVGYMCLCVCMLNEYMSCDLCASISVYMLYTCFCVCVYVMFLLVYVSYKYKYVGYMCLCVCMISEYMSCDLCASISVYVLHTYFCVCVYAMFLLAYVRCMSLC